MQDKKLREAFRALVKHLNLAVMFNNWTEDYSVKNNPPDSGCNLVRRQNLRDLQEQINELKNKKVKRKR
ncbi:MAG: hypothetical protein IIA87_03435 [Nanoarchaeota archaeon]|nr:hypothetical protein [Nanoarchaeota archaeon]